MVRPPPNSRSQNNHGRAPGRQRRAASDSATVKTATPGRNRKTPTRAASPFVARRPVHRRRVGKNVGHYSQAVRPAPAFAPPDRWSASPSPCSSQGSPPSRDLRSPQTSVPSTKNPSPADSPAPSPESPAHPGYSIRDRHTSERTVNTSTQGWRKFGNVRAWRATLRRGRVERTDATKRVPPTGKLRHYRKFSFWVPVVAENACGDKRASLALTA